MLNVRKIKIALSASTFWTQNGESLIRQYSSRSNTPSMIALSVFPLCCTPSPCQSILEYNGAAIVAMAGSECVAIAADRRLGVQAQTVSTDFQKIFEMNDKLYVGLPGLATDVLTV